MWRKTLKVRSFIDLPQPLHQPDFSIYFHAVVLVGGESTDEFDSASLVADETLGLDDLTKAALAEFFHYFVVVLNCCHPHSCETKLFKGFLGIGEVGLLFTLEIRVSLDFGNRLRNTGSLSC